MPSILAVNVGRPRERSWAGLGRTSIEKLAVDGPVRAGVLGLEGDQVSDTKHHGGVDQAVYAYAREDLDHFERLLGRPIRHGLFGENLTTEGIDVNDAEIGERWTVGSVVLEVSSVRIPCNDFKGWMGMTGFDQRAWVKRFAAELRPGPYLRVVQQGALRAGDPIHVGHRPGHGVTVRTLFRALTTERALLPEVLRADALPAKVRAKAEAYVAALDRA
jgi:MOSC domain-containing protein YiiM